MNSKLLAVAPILLLLTFNVLALSLRGAGGTVNYIGSDLNPTPARIQFSAWDNGVNGKGSLDVVATASDGKRIALYVSFDKSGAATYSYWRQGSGLPQRYSGNVVYSYNSITGLTTVTGTGPVNFQVSNIPTTSL